MKNIKRKALKRTFKEIFNFEKILNIILILGMLIGFVLGISATRPISLSDEQIKTYGSAASEIYQVGHKGVSPDLYICEIDLDLAHKTVELDINNKENNQIYPKLLYKIDDKGSAELVGEEKFGAIATCILYGVIGALMGIIATMSIFICIMIICILGWGIIWIIKAICKKAKESGRESFIKSFKKEYKKQKEILIQEEMKKSSNEDN